MAASQSGRLDHTVPGAGPKPQGMPFVSLSCELCRRLADEGVLSFDDFRKAVRRANVKTTVIGDDDLKDIATIVDEDGRSIEGDDDVTESLGRGRPGWNRSPAYTVNGVGLKMSDDGGLVHTGELDFNTWSSEKGLRGQDVWIQFALPRVYFLSAIQVCMA
eukprot:455059-Rhodomonas_salina.6